MRNMEPPEYHSCVEEVLRSSSACQEVIETLASMTAAEAELGWRQSRLDGDELPPHGPEVTERVPADVRVVMLENALRGFQDTAEGLWRRLADIAGVSVLEYSLAELIENVRLVRDRQHQRITELEVRVAQLEGNSGTAEQ